jgi:hypothetical protein
MSSVISQLSAVLDNFFTLILQRQSLFNKPTFWDIHNVEDYPLPSKQNYVALYSPFGSAWIYKEHTSAM